MGIIRNRCDKQIFSAQSVLMFNIKWLLKELTGCRDGCTTIAQKIFSVRSYRSRILGLIF